MYGKAFESMYHGSMVGSGCAVFAVWNYCIAKNHSGVLDLNPKLLGFILGAEESEMVKAIEFLCQPDPESRSQLEEGRRLLKEGQFQYRMVNWQFYETLKSKEALREYNARKQQEYRERKKRKKRKPRPLKGEEATLRKLDAGEITQEQADQTAAVTRERRK